MKSVALAIVVAGALIAISIIYTGGHLSLGFFKPEWQTRLEERLIDGDSAKYRAVVTNDLTGWVCGEVNSKNRLGAYAGWSRFSVRPPFESNSNPEMSRDWDVTLEGDYASVLDICG